MGSGQSPYRSFTLLCEVASTLDIIRGQSQSYLSDKHFSPMGVVELLDQLPAISQSDLNVSCGLGEVEAHGGTSLSLVGSLVLLGAGWK